MSLPDAFHFTLHAARMVQPQAAAALRHAILTGTLPPGTKVSEQEIADAIGTSRQPVREAFLRLAGEGLLEIRPQRGTYVSKITVAEVLDARFVREAVEADLIRLACQNATASDIDTLRDLLNQQTSAADAASFMALDEQFHRAIAHIAGKARAWDHLQRLKSQMDRVRFLQLQDFPFAALITQHSAMVEAIATQKPDAAEAEMRAHLRLIVTDLPGIEAAHPQYFTA